jgi:hypothetical protein
MTLPRWALVGANVIDGTSASVAPDAVILIEDGRILSLAPRASAAIPEGFERKMAQQMGDLWNTSHKEYERAFASF